MDRISKTKQQLLRENRELKNRLAECEDTLEAIRTGAVDALVVSGVQGERIFTLQSADYSYRVMAENMNEGAVILDNEGVIVFANKVFSDLTGREMSALVGTRVRDLLPRSLPGGLSAFLKECAVRSCRGEFSIAGPHGGAIPVSISGTNFKISERQNICLIISDLRERKEAEARLRNAYAEVEQKVVERTLELRQREEELKQRANDLVAANTELKTFSYSISHDLRAPLRAMKSFSSILLEDYSNTLDAVGKDLLIRIKSAADKMDDLIDDMLSLSKISRQEMNLQVIDMSSIAGMVVNELRQAEPERKVDVVIAQELKATGDARLIHIALSNLFANAWKYTKKTPAATIEFGAMEKSGKKVYFIRDNGVGFDMAQSHRLFTPFLRLHSESEFPGTGIGLAIVNRVIQRHGGCIWGKSEIDKGATFYFTLFIDKFNLQNKQGGVPTETSMFDTNS
jgi:PAS domain S-box-containing protein